MSQPSTRAWRSGSETPPLEPLSTTEDNQTSSDAYNPTDAVHDDELSILQYARHYGLCKDFTSESPLHVFLGRIHMPTAEEAFHDLQDPDDAFHMPERYDVQERFEVDKETAIVLRQVLHELSLPAFRYSDSDAGSRSSRKESLSLKLELPLLKTDPELDMLRFCSLSQPDLHRLILPFESVDQEKDEGYDWPTTALDLPQKVTAELAGEKLRVPRETIGYLLELQKDVYNDEDEQRTIAEQRANTKRKALTPLTPPLLPVDPEPTLIGHSSPDIDFELLSDIEDPMDAQVRKFEKEMERKDAIRPPFASDSDSPVRLENSEDMARLYSPLRSIINSPPSPTPHRIVSDFKVEVPLTPAITSSPAKKLKSSLFTEVVQDQISKASRWEKSDPGMSSEDASGILFDALRPLAINADRAIEQEQLNEADSTMRVTVPIMEFSPPQEPWNLYSRTNYDDGGGSELKAQARLIQRLRREEFSLFKIWQGNSSTERAMQWQPFSGDLRHTTLVECIDDKDHAGITFDDMSVQDIVTSDSVTWKQDGLRILDEPEEEDELQPGLFEDAEKDVDFLVRKRKMDMSEEDQPRQKEAQPKLPALDRPTPSKRTVSNPFRFLHPSAAKTEKYPRLGQIFNSGSFSASTTLDRFLILGGEKRFKKPKLINSDTNSTTRPSNSAAPEAVPPEIQEVIEPEFQLLTLPTLPQALPPRTFIISVAILQSRRNLWRQIEAYYPNAKFIERDVSTLASTPEYIDFPAPTAQHVRYDPAVEADLILSPSTGLVFTSLPKIQQRSLPGQGPQRNPFHDRLRQLAVRYERVIVLVSQGTEPPTDARHLSLNLIPQTPTNHESLALGRLHTLAATLPSDITTHFVPGGESHLAAWAVLHMAASGAELVVDPLETLWEQFLRRAGFNAFAAQAVLVALRLPDSALNSPEDPGRVTADEDGGGSGDGGRESGFDYAHGMDAAAADCFQALRHGTGVFGLRAFVRMSGRERIERFEALLGGRRVLERVNECLRQGWISESTGFQ